MARSALPVSTLLGLAGGALLAALGHSAIAQEPIRIASYNILFLDADQLPT